MRSSIHFIFTAFLAAALFPFFGWAALAAFLGGWLIDADHFLWWISTRKNLNIRQFFHYHNHEAPKCSYHSDDGDLYLGHTIEFLAVAIGAAFFHPLAQVFLIGLAGHYILDAIWLATAPKRIVLNHSIIWWVFINKIKKNGGKNYPTAVQNIK